MPSRELQKIGVALVRTISGRLAEILAHEFPTETPRTFGQIIQRIVEGLQFTLGSSDERVQRYACRGLREIGSHLRYIESASSSRIPAALITSIEALLDRLVPDSGVMLRVQWSYNYTVLEIIESYRRMFEPIIGKVRFNRAVGPVSRFYVVGVPSIEHPNVLLHSLLGHEFGHRIADRYLQQEDQSSLLATTDKKIGDMKWWSPDFRKLPPQFQLQIRTEMFNLILEARQRALEELISDAVGFHLFGISAVFATEDLVAGDAWDAVPLQETGFYPPWRYRIRHLLRLAETDEVPRRLDKLEGEAPVSRIKTESVRRLRGLVQIAAQRSDLQLIANDNILKRAYDDVEKVMAKVPAFVTKELGRLKIRSVTLEREVPPLLARLSLGIPPDDLNGKVPDFRSALATGWFYRTARIPVPYLPQRKWQPEDDEVVNRLVLKAVESIELSRAFRMFRPVVK